MKQCYSGMYPGGFHTLHNFEMDQTLRCLPYIDI